MLELGRKLPDGFERLCPSNPEIVAQLHHAVREELAVSLQDVLLRRTGIGQSRCQGLDCAEPIAGADGRAGGLDAAPSRRRARGVLAARGAEPAVPAPLMARLVRGLALLVLAALAHGAVTPARAADEGWLLGRWELVRSPDGDKKDWLEFAADGRMTTITPDAGACPAGTSTPGARSSSTTRSAPRAS